MKNRLLVGVLFASIVFFSQCTAKKEEAKVTTENAQTVSTKIVENKSFTTLRTDLEILQKLLTNPNLPEELKDKSVTVTQLVELMQGLAFLSKENTIVTRGHHKPLPDAQADIKAFRKFPGLMMLFNNGILTGFEINKADIDRLLSANGNTDNAKKYHSIRAYPAINGNHLSHLFVPVLQSDSRIEGLSNFQLNEDLTNIQNTWDPIPPDTKRKDGKFYEAISQYNTLLKEYYKND